MKSLNWPREHFSEAQQSSALNDSITRVHIRFGLLRKCARAYIASLLITGVIIPIFASLVVASLYLTLPTSPLPPLFGVRPESAWYTLVWSSFLIGILWLVVAIPFSYFCTAHGANSCNYGLLRSRLHQLNSYLGMHDCHTDEYDEINEIETVMEKAGFKEKEQHIVDALKDAYTYRTEISRKLYQSPTGLSWITGTAYHKIWYLIHQSEEAIFENLDDTSLIREAKHDFLAIQGSDMQDERRLIADIRQAVHILKPRASTFFKEYQLGDQPSDQLDKCNTTPDQQSDRATAKAILREVRSTLNQFRDSRWEGLVRQRSRLLTTMGITGIATYALLSIIILAYPPTNEDFRRVHSGILAATIFYAVAAIVGLFTRLYSETQVSIPIDDFGLSRIRLVTIPLLSGLAGIMGVVFTVIGGGATTLMNTTATVKPYELSSTMFTFNPVLWSIAAIFGMAPNLLIGSLQRKANQYRSELLNTTTTTSTTNNRQ